MRLMSDVDIKPSLKTETNLLINQSNTHNFYNKIVHKEEQKRSEDKLEDVNQLWFELEQTKKVSYYQQDDISNLKIENNKLKREILGLKEQTHG